MSSNSISESYGIINLNGTISQIKLNEITINGYHPINTAFGQLKTVPTIVGNKINDPSSNSCTYNGNTYTLVEIQICKPLHDGYKLPNMNDTPSAEMVLTFSGNSDFAGILLCFPIYNTGVSDHDAYLNQIINHSESTKLATLASVLEKQSSLGYSTHFETIESNKTNLNNLYIFVFPNGIHLSDVNYQKLVSQTGALQLFTLHPTIRNGLPSVSKSKIVDEVRKPIKTSNNGNIELKNMATCNTEFIDKFEYHPKPPRAAVSRTPTQQQSQDYTSSQYKCVPFNNYTIDPNTKIVRVKTKAETLAEKTKNNPSLNKDDVKIDTEGIIVIAASCITVVIAGGLLYLAYKNIATD
jgi:hypothetical protein